MKTLLLLAFMAGPLRVVETTAFLPRIWHFVSR